MLRGFVREVAWLFGPTLVVGTLLLGPLLFLEWRDSASRTHSEDSGAKVWKDGRWEAMSVEQEHALDLQIAYGCHGPIVGLVAFLSVGNSLVRWLTPLVERVGRWGK